MGIPNREDPLAIWLEAFKGGIVANPALYMTASTDAATIATAVDAFIAARAVANTPATRNVGTIDGKNASRQNAEGVCRLFYGLIQRNAGISNEDKLLIGVTPLGETRTPRPCPQSAPTLNIVGATPGGAITVQYRDSINPTSRAKPFGATMLQLMVVVAAENAANPDDAKFIGNYTTNPMPVTFDAADRGKQATLFGRWGGKRNEFGQWSLPVSMTIAA